MIHLLRISTLKNVFWTAGGNALMAATSFVASIFVIRNLGPSEYGILQEFLAIFTVIQSFENIINPNLFKRELLSHPASQAELISAIGILIGAFGLLLAFSVAALILLGILPVDYWLLVIMLIGMLFRFTNGISFYFDAHLKSLKSQISLNTGNGISSIFKVLASYLNPTAFLQAFAYPMLYLVTGSVHLIQMRRELAWKAPSSRTLTHVLSLAKESFPLFLSTLVEMLKTRLPLIYLGFASVPEALGIYSAGVKLIEPWAFLTSALSISFWPKLVTSRRESEQKFESFVKVYFAVIFYLFLPLTILSLLFGQLLIERLLGPIYINAVPVFEVHSIILLLSTAIQAINLVELSQGMGKIILTRNLLSLILMAVTVSPLSGSFGIKGVAFSVLIANAGALLILPAVNKPSRTTLRIYLRMILKGPWVILSEFRKRKTL